MGQQQLLLVILVTIIVGIATVVAINTFGSAADSANLDAVRQDIASIAASAQGYYMKPKALNGGGQNFTDVSFKGLAFGSNGSTTDNKTAWNENGKYVISGGAAGKFIITAHPASSIDGYSSDGSTEPDDAPSADQITATILPNDISY